MTGSNKNNKIRRFSQYRTDRLSDIPTMASAISKKITEFKQQYIKLVAESADFFTSYESEQKRLKKLKANLDTYQKQITIITDYKRQHGKLPKIKGQQSTERYLHKLYRLTDDDNFEYKELYQAISSKRLQRHVSLDNLVDDILDLLNGRKIFSQFLGTIALSTPLPNEPTRCLRNEKFKPIYITALSIALFEEVRQQYAFDDKYLVANLADILPDNASHLMSEGKDALQPRDKIKYREEVLKPIAKVALIQSIGTYAPEVEAIFDGDRYRSLDLDSRSKMLALAHRKSIDYLKFGIGLPPRRFDTREERTAYTQYESAKLRFMLRMLNEHKNKHNELNDLIRIPMVYSSFLISTKPQHDYNLIYDAYDVIEQGIKNNSYVETFARLFLNMVGKFPVGSGIYFISKETNQVEKAIVSSLYPKNVDEPYVKQITRQQTFSFSQSEVVVSREANLFYQLNKTLDQQPKVLALHARYRGEFTWNANEQWDIQIPAITFWKKDGSLKEN